jgi:hypothetical protein
MKTLSISLWLLPVLISLTIISAPAAEQESCANLANQKLDKVTITSAVFMNDPQGFALPQTPGMFGTPPGTENHSSVLPGGWIHPCLRLTHNASFPPDFLSVHPDTEIIVSYLGRAC